MMNIEFDPLWKLQLEKISFGMMNLEPLEIERLDRYQFPKKGGVYLFTTQGDECVYVGKTGDLRSRVFVTHLNGKGKSSLREALLGRKKTRNISAVTIDDEIDYYIEDNFLIRFAVIEDILLRGCVEDFLNAILKPVYSVSLSMT